MQLMCSPPNDSSWNTWVLSKTGCSEGQDRNYVVLERYRIRSLWVSGHNIVPTNICLTFSCIVSAFKCLIWLLTHWQGDHCHCTITPAEYVLCLRYTEDSPAWRQQTHLVLYLEAIWWAKLTTKKPPNREKVALNGSSLPLIGNLKQEGRKSPYSSAAATDSSHHFIHVCRRPVRS